MAQWHSKKKNKEIIEKKMLKNKKIDFFLLKVFLKNNVKIMD